MREKEILRKKVASSLLTILHLGRNVLIYV